MTNVNRNSCFVLIYPIACLVSTAEMLNVRKFPNVKYWVNNKMVRWDFVILCISTDINQWMTLLVQYITSNYSICNSMSIMNHSHLINLIMHNLSLQQLYKENNGLVKI